MRYEGGMLPKDVGGFVQSLGVDHNVETLYVAPSGLSILYVLGVCLKLARSSGVLSAEKVLINFHYGI